MCVCCLANINSAFNLFCISPFYNDEDKKLGSGYDGDDNDGHKGGDGKGNSMGKWQAQILYTLVAAGAVSATSLSLFRYK